MKVSLIFIGLVAASYGLMNLSFKNKPVQHVSVKDLAGKSTGYAIVELFTSEGCSSCPAADDAVASIAQTYKENVYVLGFHVDYWNRLGWKDEFSTAAFSDRQRKYATALGIEGVYTPQVVVNGQVEFVGSNIDRLNTVVKQDLNTATNQPINITAVSTGNNTIEVAYQINENANTLLNIALVQLHAITNVKRGENEGRKLNHINIVRDFKTVPAKNSTGKITLTLPAGMAAKDYKLIGYLQNSQSLQTLGVAETSLK